MMKDDGNFANDLIIETEDDNEECSDKKNTLQDTVKELSHTLFKKYPHKTSVLRYENIEGMTQADVLNEYMSKNFGRRYTVLDTLCNSIEERVVSKDGFGIASIIELLKSIQATFEQHEVPEGLRGLVRK